MGVHSAPLFAMAVNAEAESIEQLLASLSLKSTAAPDSAASIDGDILAADANLETAGGAAAVAVTQSGFPKWMQISDGGEPWSSSGITLLTRDDMLLFVEHSKQKRLKPIHIEMLGGGIEPNEAAMASTCEMLSTTAVREFMEELRGSVIIDKSSLVAAFDGGAYVEYVYPPEPPIRLYSIRSASFLVRTDLSSKDIAASFTSTRGVQMTSVSNEVRDIYFMPFTPELLSVRELDPPVIEAAAGAYFIKSRARRVLEALRLYAESKSSPPRTLFYAATVSLPHAIGESSSGGASGRAITSRGRGAFASRSRGTSSGRGGCSRSGGSSSGGGSRSQAAGGGEGIEGSWR